MDNNHPTDMDNNHPNDVDNNQPNDEAEPWLFEDTDSDPEDDDYDYRINIPRPPMNTTTNNDRIVDIDDDAIQQNLQNRADFLRHMQFFGISDGEGLNIGHYPRVFIVGTAGYLQSMVKRAFNLLPERYQQQIRSFNPSQPCLAFVTHHITVRKREMGDTNFQDEDVAQLSQSDIIELGIAPVAKALTKNWGPNSLRKIIGGGTEYYSSSYSRLNTVSPTLLRRGGVFVGFLVDESLHPSWDDIIIHEDSENQIAAAKAESNQAQPCLAFVTHHITVRKREMGDTNFQDEDVARLSQSDIIELGIAPVAKTLTKKAMTKIIRGGSHLYSRLNTVSPTLLRQDMIVGFLVDESLHPNWDDIIIHADSENQIAAAIAAANGRADGIFYVYCVATGELLKVAKGIVDLRDSVGGFDSRYTTESLQTLIRDQENGRLYHRLVDDSVYAFFIRITPEGDTEESQEPASDGETRIDHLVSRVKNHRSVPKTSHAFHWIIFPRQGWGVNQPPPGTRTIAYGIGPQALKEELAVLTKKGTKFSNFGKNWCKKPGVKIKSSLTLEMWKKENVNGFLYNSKANKWVKVVSTAEERTRLVNQGNHGQQQGIGTS